MTSSVVDAKRAALMKPLEEFTALHARAVRTTPGGLFDLSYPNPSTHRDERALDVLQSVVSQLSTEDLQYTPFGGATIVRRQIAAEVGRRHGLSLKYRSIVMTPGATAALCVAMRSLLVPGDEVILITPCWMDYPLYLENLGIEVRFVESTVDKRIDVDRVAAAWGPKTAGIIISQPNCPTGVVSTGAELNELSGALLQLGELFGRRPILLSDEVHRDQTWDDIVCESPMSIYPNTVSVYSFGKAWAMQGQRTGYLALSPDFDDHDRVIELFEQAMRIGGFGAPTAVMQLVAAQLAKLEPATSSLAADQRFVRAELAATGYSVIHGRGSAFVYIACPVPLDDFAFVRRLAADGVLAMPSSLFFESDHFRLALNVSGSQLEQCVERLKTTLSGVH